MTHTRYTQPLRRASGRSTRKSGRRSGSNPSWKKRSSTLWRSQQRQRSTPLWMIFSKSGSEAGACFKDHHPQEGKICEAAPAFFRFCPCDGSFFLLDRLQPPAPSFEMKSSLSGRTALPITEKTEAFLFFPKYTPRPSGGSWRGDCGGHKQTHRRQKNREPPQGQLPDGLYSVAAHSASA